MSRWRGLAAVGLVACVQALGIKDAELDPLRKPAETTGGVATACSAYCASLMGRCNGKLQQYPSHEVCEAVCKLFPAGANSAANTVECRVEQGKSVVTLADPDTHCAPAGPSGEPLCGTSCEAYCLLLQKSCTADFATLYNDLAACQKKCTMIPSLGKYDQSIKKGDSLECRLYHTTQSALDAVHCDHAVGTSICVKSVDVGGAGGATSAATTTAVTTGAGGAGGG